MEDLLWWSGEVVGERKTLEAGVARGARHNNIASS
jgi:hypothetical protein